MTTSPARVGVGGGQGEGAFPESGMVPNSVNSEPRRKSGGILARNTTDGSRETGVGRLVRSQRYEIDSGPCPQHP
jgi:hypothetical protein